MATDTKDPEIEALTICWPAIRDLDHAAAQRVMGYLAERVRIEIPRPSLVKLLRLDWTRDPAYNHCPGNGL